MEPTLVLPKTGPVLASVTILSILTYIVNIHLKENGDFI